MCGSTNSSFTKEAAALSCEAVGLWDGASRQHRHLWHLAAVLALSETSFSGAVWHSGMKLNGLLALICETLLLQVPRLAQCAREAHGRELRGWINAASFGSARLELFGFNTQQGPTWPLGSLHSPWTGLETFKKWPKTSYVLSKELPRPTGGKTANYSE